MKDVGGDGMGWDGRDGSVVEVLINFIWNFWGRRLRWVFCIDTIDYLWLSRQLFGWGLFYGFCFWGVSVLFFISFLGGGGCASSSDNCDVRYAKTPKKTSK